MNRNPPATLASIASEIPAAVAFSQIWAPCSAISSLLAVTTDFPLEIAESMISAATVVPPISSAITWTSGLLTTSCQLEVRSASGERAASAGGLDRTDREQRALTLSENPSLPVICAALSERIRSVPRPTFPNPIIPTLISDTSFHYRGSTRPASDSAAARKRRVGRL